MRVGFIGLGNMGQPMARHLLKAGHTVTVYNRSRRRAEELGAEGAHVADHAAEACEGDVVMTMLADDRAVEEVVLGSNGVLRALAAETIHVSMSTISVALSRRLTELHAQLKRAYVSAPVFGRPDAAAAATLLVVAAGPLEAIERCRPLFDAVGQRTFNVGEDPPAANVIKLGGNFLIACVVESLAEVFAFMRKSGIDPRQFYELMTDNIFTAPVYKNYGRIIVEENYAPAGFKATLGLKDIRLALGAAESVNVPLPIANIVRDHLLTAIARGQQDLDWTVVARITAENAGL
ncbi:MAG TPA: NAD(P)-dependent oxidoreductase [Terriglobia bacterium]|nr:NAD(P)-dependent oxidoreductase [Terriglobia bacterium]